MVAVVAHELSSQYLGEGFVLVARDDAIEFESVAAAQELVERFAPEPAFVVERVSACSAA